MLRRGAVRRAVLLCKVVLLRSGIWQNPLFDHDWYRERYPDVPESRWRAYRDYRRRPLSDPRDPNRYLDMRWFLGQQPDLLGARLHPLDHYLLLGWREGREPKPGFDTPGFMRRHPDCSEREANPVEYLLRVGARPPVSSLRSVNPAAAGDGAGVLASGDGNDTAGRAGVVWLRDGAIVEGWLADDADVADVEVLCDGELVWRGRPRRSLVDEAGRQHARGFRVDLPPSAMASRRSAVEARAVGAGQLRGSPAVADCIDRFEGGVDDVALDGCHLVIEGWAHDRARPLDPVEVEVLCDDEIVATIVAACYREDLEAAGCGVGRHAFVERLEVSPVKVLSVTLRIAGTPLVLCREVVPGEVGEQGAATEDTSRDAEAQADTTIDAATPQAIRGSARSRGSVGGPHTHLAFAVTEVDDRGGTGDYFTALELGNAIQAQEGWRVTYLDMSRGWYELDGVDVLIVMRDEYDLVRAKARHPDLVAVAWARNWFDRWTERPWLDDYDLVLGSSRRGASHLSDALSRTVPIVPVATNPDRFGAGTEQPSLATDYCFTGSFFYAPREIMYDLEPTGLRFEFGVYGHGWEHSPVFAPYARGPVPYPAMPDVYASTKLVIDDAQFPVKDWGSVNCRVFDALAAGAMVVTNGETGARELFGDLLPTYSSKQELDDLVWRYLDDDRVRAERVEALRDRVLAGHTYELRASQVVNGLRESLATG